MPGAAKIGPMLIDAQRGPLAITAKPEDRVGLTCVTEKAAWNGRGC